MGRAEIRRAKKAADKAEKKKGDAAGMPFVSSIFHTKADMPIAVNAVSKPPIIPIVNAVVEAPVRINGYTAEELSGLTGINVKRLKAWCDEREKEIREAAIKEAQEKLDRAEDFIALQNILCSVKALEGFRYAKAAASYMIDNYHKVVKTIGPDNVRETYDYLHKTYDIEYEFDDPDLNELMGFDVVDWRLDYIGQKVPVTIIDKISNDAANIQSAEMQLAVIWTLAEDFGFHKHLHSDSNKMKKFMSKLMEKYEIVDSKDGIHNTQKLLKEKYGLNIGFREKVTNTLIAFGLR